MSNFLITGYYFKQNLGDELLMKSATLLFNNKSTRFVGIDNINIYNTSYIDELIKWTDKIILFGGEVINNFFLDKLISIRTYSLFKFNKFIPFYAIGVSCNSDFNEILSKVDIFETIIFRNITDFNLFSSRLPNNNIYLLPDPVFYIKPNIIKKPFCYKLLCNSNRQYHIGIFLSQTAKDKEIIINNIIQLVNTYNHHFHLFTMCNGSIDNENDLIINKSIYDNVNKNNIYLYSSIDDILNNINKIDLAICWRFHSHVLCIQYNIPFISLSDTPKVTNLINEYKLCNLAYNTTNIIAGFKYLLTNSNIIKLQLSEINKNIKNAITNFISVINNSLIIRNIPKFYINTDDDNLIKKIISIYDFYKTDNNIFNATLLLYLITGKLKTTYHWGLVEKMNNNDISHLISDINWLIKEEIKIGNNSFFYKMSKYTNYDVNYTNKKSINIHYFNQDDMKGLHRAGWEYVISNIENISTFNNSALLCDLYIDRTFHWNYDICCKLGIIPYKQKWIGFIHHTDNEEYTNFNINELFKKQYFIESLKCCKGLIVLTKYLQRKLEKILISYGYYHIRVYMFYHPTEFVNETFNMNDFETQNIKKVIQIGAWYRKIDAIFKLQLGNNKLNFKKYALNGPAMDGYYNKLSNKCDNCISRDDKSRIINLDDNELNSVEILKEVSSIDYDKLLITCIIFIYLFDASAVNTIIEAIVRNTPILVNKIEPVIEYLGSDYPFYYESMEEATSKLNNIKIIKKTYEYLKKMNKTFLKIDTFINSFKKIFI